MEEFINQTLYKNLDNTLNLSISNELDDYNGSTIITHKCYVCNEEIKIKINKYSDFVKLTEYSVLCNEHKNMTSSPELKNYFYKFQQNILKQINYNLQNL